jgi:hypothetical protein
MISYDPLRLDSALALDRDTFCVVFSGKDYEDMYSCILVYEGRLEQPWSRSDVPRKIEALTGTLSAGGRAVIHALSDEGDVYTLPMGESSSHRKIEGAGVYSDDATELGYVNSMARIDDVLLVSGYHSQLYRVAGADIDWFHRDKLPQAPETYDYLSFGALGGFSERDLYMSVSYYPTSTNRELTEDEEEEMGRLYLAGRNEEAAAIRRASEGPSRVIEGRLYHWDGEAWSIVAEPRSGKYHPEPATLSDVFMEAPDKVWAVGDNGVILVGNAQHGFQDVSFKGNEENLRSITRFGDRMVIASDYGLHWFDGHILTPLEPVLDPGINRNVPNPIKVQAAESHLYYFDAKHGIHVYDGAVWAEITVPPNLLQRDYGGLAPAR